MLEAFDNDFLFRKENGKGHGDDKGDDDGGRGDKGGDGDGHDGDSEGDDDVLLEVDRSDMAKKTERSTKKLKV